MNERIRELAVQADLLIKKTNGDEFRYGNFDPKFQKFAELIILDCIEICKSRVGNSDYNTGRLHCVSDIRERFGLDGMSIQDKKNLIKELLGVKHD